VVPKVPGIDRPIVHWAPDALGRGIDVGENVIVLGAGAIGIEYAIHYAKEGRNVTLVEAKDAPTIAGSTAGVLGGEYDLREGLKHEKITLRLNSSLKSVGDRSVVVQDVNTGAEEEIPASAVLLSVGMKPRFHEGQAFRSSAPATSVFLVGDCLDVNEIRGAVRTAFDISARI
jgi:pyruvate/2-oxoglutarate dehydrogenase complex dihydrolipoamide dehydrogenase (E3) component